ncbi:LOW QUALITY PROTEIN: hypothetical protein CVT26_009736 [Gymnopilus dilepis]|uniref:Uncharacterized protein n=1 Tax=Gymnopilus dilepis TaxID=231916 RepID=A0A409WCS6_9AGAR|nr:LOW QUALITY PROTEIN: hypothetical protein CVT26_009736 [Gymnopilus dilepis]
MVRSTLDGVGVIWDVMVMLMFVSVLGVRVRWQAQQGPMSESLQRNDEERERETGLPVHDTLRQRRRKAVALAVELAVAVSMTDGIKKQHAKNSPSKWRLAPDGQKSSRAAGPAGPAINENGPVTTVELLDAPPPTWLCSLFSSPALALRASQTPVKASSFKA